LANTFEWLKRFIIAGIIFAVLTYIFTYNLSLSFWVFIIVAVLATAYAFESRCKNCDNCFAVWEINNRLIDTKVTHIPFTKRVEVGHSEKYYHYVDGGTRQTHTEIHYEDRDFIKEITKKTYEHTYKCKFCGNITKTYSTSKSSQTFRD
jgi:hypothetical protein